MKKIRVVSFLVSLLALVVGILAFWTIYSGSLSFVTAEPTKDKIMQFLGTGALAIGAIMALASLISKNKNVVLIVFNIILNIVSIIALALYFTDILKPLIGKMSLFISIIAFILLGLNILLATVCLALKTGEPKEKKVKTKANATVEDEEVPMMVNHMGQTASEPKSETVNIADRVQKMRQDLLEGNFEHYEDTEEELMQTQEEPVVMEPPVQPIPAQVQPRPFVQEEVRIGDRNSTEEFGKIVHKNPYKEVILPRRMRGVKYNGELANKKSNTNTSNRNPAQLDGSYRDKLFVGDGDQIWEVVKNQERPENIAFKTSKSDDITKTNVLANVKTNKNKNTMEMDASKIQDPLNETVAGTTPTIDWDE